MSQYNNNLNNLIIDRNENLNNYSNVNIINNIINNNNNNILFLNQFKSAFSLVELSIVLIIIGLLISAVIGGKALIDEARIIGIKNEFEEVRTIIREFANMGGTLYALDPWDHISTRCARDIWHDIAAMNLVDSSKIQNGDGYKSKLKTKGKHIIWGGTYGCTVFQRTEKLQFALEYGNMETLGYLCPKLANKLRSFYGEKPEAAVTNSSWPNYKNIGFSCQCHNKQTGQYTDCKSANATMVNLIIYMREL